MNDNPLEKHIASYVNNWKCVPLEQLKTQKFVESGFYDKEVCGTFEECLDRLTLCGKIRRVKFEVDGKEIFLLMSRNSEFKGWC